MTAEMLNEAQVYERIRALENTIDLQESAITELVLRIDDVGWARLNETEKDTGVKLSALKKLVERHYDVAVANPVVGRAIRVRAAYTWGQGLEINTEKESDKEIIKNIKKNSNVFRRMEQLELENTATGSGNVFLLVSGKRSSGKIKTVPITQITDAIYHSDPTDGVMLYVRKWIEHADGKDTEHTRAYLNEDEKYSGTHITIDNKRIEVDKTSKIVHLKFNAPTEWTFGMPELFGTNFWAQAYKESMESDLDMKKALARFAWKITSTDAGGVNKAASQVAGTPGTGGVAGMTEGTNLTAVNKSGATVNFNDNWALAAIIASGFDIPLSELLYQTGATDTNTISETNALVLGARQEAWCETLEKCFELMGVDVNVIMPRIFSEPVHRVAQALSVLGATNLLHPSELREAAILQLKRYGVESFEHGLPEPGAWAEFTHGLAENPGTPPLNTPDDSHDDTRSPSGPLADGDNELRDGETE